MDAIPITCDVCRGVGREPESPRSYAAQWARAQSPDWCVWCLGSGRIDAVTTIRAEVERRNGLGLLGLFVLVGHPAWVARLCDAVGFGGAVALLGDLPDDLAARVVSGLLGYEDSGMLLGLTISQWQDARFLHPEYFRDVPTYFQAGVVPSNPHR